MLRVDVLFYCYIFIYASIALSPVAAKCPKPPALVNGRTRVLYGGLRAEFQCNPGFMPFGTNYALCSEGRWTWEPPICVASGCRMLKPMEHGFMAVSYSGAVARIWCKDNYFLKGSDLLTCDGREWNGTQPDCVAKYGSVQWDRLSKSNDYSFDFKPHRKSRHHSWDKSHEELLKDADYSCIQKTSALSPPRIPHASPSTKWVVVEGKARLYTVYRCKWGYVAVGDAKTLYCKNNEWTGTKPKCLYKGIPDRTEQAYPQADDWTSYGVNAHDTRVRSADYTCFKAGQGVTAPEVAYSTKVPRSSIADGMPHLYVEYQCHSGYSLDGPSEFMYCKNEKWHGQLPRCIWKGAAYGDDAHVAESVCERSNGGCSHTCTMVGDKAVCSCSDGMQLNSDGQTCQDIDECKSSNHGCQQTCFNTHGSYTCLCDEGYNLAADGYGCHEAAKSEKNSLDDKIPPLVVFHHQ